MFDETRADIVTEGVHTDTGCSLSLFMCGYMDVNAGCRLWAVCSHRAAVLAVLWSGSQPLTHTHYSQEGLAHALGLLGLQFCP